MATMKAAYFTHNKTFKIEQVETAPPGPGEVEIDVAFCGICGTDLHIFHGAMPHRLGDRRVLGHEMSGTVSAVGDGVKRVYPSEFEAMRKLRRAQTHPQAAVSS